MKRANEVLKRAASFFGAEPDRQHRMQSSLLTRTKPTLSKVASLVSSSSAGCQVAPSTFYGARDRAPSARTLSDAVLSGELYSLWEANRKVYGVRKLWKAAGRSGIDVGRDQTARLMRSLGIEGVKRSKRVKTTKPDPAATRYPDLVKRVFSSTAPNQLWVTDLTFVSTWAGRNTHENRSRPRLH